QYVDWSWDNNPPCEGYTATIPRDICPPRQFDARPHLLFRNDAGRRFLAAAKEAGPPMPRQDAAYTQRAPAGEKARAGRRQGGRDCARGTGSRAAVRGGAWCWQISTVTAGRRSTSPTTRPRSCFTRSAAAPGSCGWRKRPWWQAWRPTIAAYRTAAWAWTRAT